jgi:predicted Rossmann fold nucleotide-binding protein DprA/Smf involved in DNA uptake
MRLVWLQECPRVGPAVLSAAVGLYRGAPPAAFYGQPAAFYRNALAVPAPLAATLETHLSAVPAALAAFANLPVTAVTPFDFDYPTGLRRLKSPPAIVLAHGCRGYGITHGNFCVVSSSRREWDAADTVKAAFEIGLNAGWRIVAGHNRPVYQWALLAAKRRGAAATMVLDRGLVAAFDDDLRRDPVPAARIWGYAFDSDRSLALSSFRLRDPWIGANARFRDAMVVALSDVVIAIGVTQGGTMHRLCREAAARGQTVYATPDCLPLLEAAGARPWHGEMPAPLHESAGAQTG